MAEAAADGGFPVLALVPGQDHAMSFLRQAAEPHADTAAVLKELMAANPPPAQLSSTAAAR